MPIIADLLNQEITTIYSTVIDGYGRATKTTLYSNVACRWQEKFTTVLDSEGKEAVAKVLCWLFDTHDNEALTIAPGYIFLFNGTEYEVIASENEVNLAGNREYIKVFLR